MKNIKYYTHKKTAIFLIILLIMAAALVIFNNLFDHENTNILDNKIISAKYEVESGRITPHEIVSTSRSLKIAPDLSIDETKMIPPSRVNTVNTSLVKKLDSKIYTPDYYVNTIRKCQLNNKFSDEIAKRKEMQKLEIENQISKIKKDPRINYGMINYISQEEDCFIFSNSVKQICSDVAGNGPVTANMALNCQYIHEAFSLNHYLDYPDNVTYIKWLIALIGKIILSLFGLYICAKLLFFFGNKFRTFDSGSDSYLKYLTDNENIKNSNGDIRCIYCDTIIVKPNTNHQKCTNLNCEKKLY